jgi:hypothetical protein
MRYRTRYFAKENNMVYEKNHARQVHGLYAGWFAASATALLLAVVPLAVMAQSSATALAVQSSSERGVTVKVTPKSLGTANGRWEFSVVLDTHSADLSDDLTQSAKLVTDDGRTFKPVGWTGAPPGGHHREGELAFDVPMPKPSAIELHINRPSETGARIFRWQP